MSNTTDSYSESFPRLQRAAALHAHRILRDRGEADDVVQDALLRAYVAWDDIAGYDEAWIGRVAINLAIGRLRRKSVVVSPIGGTNEPSLPIDTRIDVARAIDALPRRQRQVVVLRYVADLSLQAVGELLDISTGSVKRHLHRAITALRDPSAGLSGTYSNDTPEEELMSSTKTNWRTNFRPAAEPAEGWPPAPWDHRWFEAEGDNLQRLACDHRTGQPILDADGDEVLTGPGLDFVLVKADRTLTREWTPWRPGVPEAPLHRLDASALEVLDLAQGISAAFSDTGVGLEHVAVALLELMPEEAERAIGTDSRGLRTAMAQFRDGPHAAARVALVECRLNEGWSPASAARVLPAGMLDADMANWLTEIVRRVDYFDAQLPEEEPTLMVRAIDLLHMVADPAPPYYFIREVVEKYRAARAV